MKILKRCCQLLLPVLLLSVATAAAEPVVLSLDESIKMALQNSHDIKYYQSAREKSYWALRQAENNKKVSINYVHIGERYNTKPADTYTTVFDNQLAATLPLYSGGNLEQLAEQAKFDMQVADLDIVAAKQQLKNTVVNDYLTVLEYRNELQINQDTVKNYHDHLDLVQAKYEAGLVAKTDILSSQVDLAKAQDNLIKAQNNYNNALAALNNDIGLPHDTQVSLKDDFGYEPYKMTLEDCLQYALAHRPEIAQYDAKMKNAAAGVKVAESGKLPTLDLTAQEDWNDNHLPGIDNNNWLIKLTASYNVFDSGVTDAKIRQARHNTEMVANSAAKEQDTILLDVRQYYLSMKEAEKRIETNKVPVKQAEESLMIQKVRYEVGVGTNLDLLDAVLALDSAKKDYNQALYDYNTNKAKLEKSIGLAVE